MVIQIGGRTYHFRNGLCDRSTEMGGLASGNSVTALSEMLVDRNYVKKREGHTGQRGFTNLTIK